MNNAEYVAEMIKDMKEAEAKPHEIAWETARACVGWGYVFGARGQECTPAYRRSAYNSHGDEHSTIKSSCKNFDGTGTCKGCKWYPDGKRTRVFDCRGFTYWILKQVYGWELQGAGATSLWNTDSNWTAKGPIETMPKDTLCCLFYRKKGSSTVMAHTGLGLNNETVECSSGVQYFSNRNSKWQYWAVPKCVSSDVHPSLPDPSDSLPMLRRGDKGYYVQKLQSELISRGYSCGNSGADGIFGSDTEKAVKSFQKASGLAVDGIVGRNTWNALETHIEPITTYSVTVRGLTAGEAEKLANQYQDVTVTEEV